ncbi:hypothetical protein ASF88_04670 [Leifsonia sp. Leaf336]|uniref:hypothetical protein n=1 Tax=Leifsonia sp. Leaf336 TaxID=1736341 RepID=UPI0006FE54BA|nr:hypothetical protein [Leifsonia sp. Leaf336]KQR54126.1 hypothetical protein ASF88_04670 [Leifsonia sp. Leaf336]
MVTLVVVAAAAGFVLSAASPEPDASDYVTITSPSRILDVGADGTPGPTLTGEAGYSFGPSPSDSSPTPTPSPTPGGTIIGGAAYHAGPALSGSSRTPRGSPTVWSAVTVDRHAVCDDDGAAAGSKCNYTQIAMDFTETGGQFAASWSFFIAASVFPSSIDGLHTFSVELHIVGADGTDTTRSDSKRIRVVPPGQLETAPSSPAQGTPSPSPTPSTPAAITEVRPPGGHTASELATGRPDADSVYTALTPVQRVRMTATSAVILAAVTLILLLLIGFPGVLIESTVSKHYDELFPWVKRRRENATRPGSPAKVATWITVTLGVALASIISGFVDPQFGLNLGSARVLLSSAAVFIVLSVIGWLVVERVIHSTDPALKPSIEFKWLSLLVVILAVLLSRLTGFEPGIVFGLVVGLSFGASLSTVQSARTVLVGVAYAFMLGLGSWLAYSALKPAIGSRPGVVSQFACDLLAGLAVAGLSTLPVALLPITGLGGAAVFRWNRWIWALVYAAGLATFFVVLMPLPQAWGEVSLALAVWVALYAGFACGAVTFWAFFRIKDGRQTITAARRGR